MTRRVLPRRQRHGGRVRMRDEEERFLRAARLHRLQQIEKCPGVRPTIITGWLFRTKS